MTVPRWAALAADDIDPPDVARGTPDAVLATFVEVKGIAAAEALYSRRARLARWLRCVANRVDHPLNRRGA